MMRTRHLCFYKQLLLYMDTHTHIYTYTFMHIFRYSYTYTSNRLNRKSLSHVQVFVTPWSVHGILQARILEWVAFPSPGYLPNPGIEPRSTLIAGGFFTSWATKEAPSSTLAWKIPWMEEPARLQSMGSQRVRHDWGTSLSFFLYIYIIFPYHCFPDINPVCRSTLDFHIHSPQND